MNEDPHARERDQAISKLKKHKAADAGGWTTETAQSCLNHPHLKLALLQWIHVATEGPARREDYGAPAAWSAQTREVGPSVP